MAFRLGESVFQRLWVPAPASTTSADGLGPLFNARACESCHPRGGRGPAPQGGEAPMALVARLSVPPATATQRALREAGRLGLIPEPRYGAQLQPFAAPGLPGEGRLAVAWEEHAVHLAGGLTVTLRRPRPRLEAPGYGVPDPALRLSPRLAPPLRGLGLLEQVPEAAILAAADPEDADGDGIRGRANRVAEGRLGRFGWKATEPGLPEQAAAAFALDLGLSTPLRPEPWGDCTEGQPVCRAAPHGLVAQAGAPQPFEVAPALFGLVVSYLRALAAPTRPAPEAPLRPVPEAPLHPVPEALLRPAPEALLRPMPEALLRPVPEAPLHPVPEALLRPAPEAPLRPTPEALLHPMPEASLPEAAPISAPRAQRVRRGEALFGALGCAACHRPRLETPAGPIAPYTDLLLHDLGEGLADGHAEWRAGGRDWRTAPLWGLGRAAPDGATDGAPDGATDGAPDGAIRPAALLHDGRARSVLEAVLWHGGEAQRARDRVTGLAPEDRAALLTFLDSL